MSKTVTVFSTTYCATCKQLKKWMDDKEIKYDSVNLEEHPDRQAEVMEKSGGLQVPVTFITDEDGNEQVINGPQYSDILSALGMA